MKAVYFPDTEFLHAEVGSHPSQVWRAIMEGRDVLNQGLIHRIGTGAETNPWDDNWLPRDGALRPFACTTTDPPQLVAEFTDHTTKQWDMVKLQASFLPMDVEVIKAIPISTRVQSDFWAWQL